MSSKQHTSSKMKEDFVSSLMHCIRSSDLNVYVDRKIAEVDQYRDRVLMVVIMINAAHIELDT